MIASTPTRPSNFRMLGRAGLVAMAALALVSCGGKKHPKADLAASRVTTIGVNSYLWRASLEALSFMPLLQTDSNGGVIVTDWYANPNNPGERMKVTVTILDQDLRADALSVIYSPEEAQALERGKDPRFAAEMKYLTEIIERLVIAKYSHLELTQTRFLGRALSLAVVRHARVNKRPEIEDRLRKVETHVRKLDEDHWNKSDPEKVARSEGFAAQLEAKIAKLEAELAEAKAKGDARKVKDAEDAIAAQKTWLDALG